MLKIGIIGGGNMGEALIKSLVKKASLNVCELSLKRQFYLKKKYKVACSDLETLTQKSKVIVLAVKPQGIDEVLKALSKLIKKDHVVLSIAAGVPSRYIEKKIGKNVRVIRSMPNMPALIGEGITAIAKGKNAKQADVRLACQVLEGVGEVVVVEEKYIDSVTAVSGSGPAYVFLFMECLTNAAKTLGLKDELAQKLVLQTFFGSADLVKMIQQDPGVLRAKVTSKGGTTQAALDIFKKKKIQDTITQALKAAQKRAKELASK